jgi:hypothetical protein
LVADATAIAKAAAACTHQPTYAFLCPRAAEAWSMGLRVPPDRAMLNALRSEAFATPKPVALVEICRRTCKRHAMDLDRADKQSRLAED